MNLSLKHFQNFQNTYFYIKYNTSGRLVLNLRMTYAYNYQARTQSKYRAQVRRSAES